MSVVTTTVAQEAEKAQVLPSAVLVCHAKNVGLLFANYGINDPRVFGSVARGTDTPDSDIDFLFSAPQGFGMLDSIALERELETLLNVKVDLIVDSPYRAASLKQAHSEALPLSRFAS